MEVRLDSMKVKGTRGLELRMGDPVQCNGMATAQGLFSLPIEMETMSNLLNQLGQVGVDRGTLVVNGSRVQGNSVTIIGKDERSIRKESERLLKVTRKAIGCVGCGVYLGKCKEGALHLDGGRIRIDEAYCVHCGECIEPCTALTFSDVDF